jgi:3-methyladenine DNA glycosylase/8-oxoguanine DNA glycosylase
VTGPSHWVPAEWAERDLPVNGRFALNETCGPVAWAGGRWPDQDWIDGCLVWVREDANGAWPIVSWQPEAGQPVTVASPAPLADHRLNALARSLGIGRKMPSWDDPVIADLGSNLPGLRPFSHGSLYLGLVTSIIGQSISVASAATTQRRLASALSNPTVIGGRTFWPLPSVERLSGATPADVRASGVTWRRAEALVAIARIAADGDLPDRRPGWDQLDTAGRIVALRELPLVGPWTARSALLWGTAESGVWPAGDVALLRAARLAYANPDLSMRDLDAMAASWEPDAGWASRLLWGGLFGSASATMG